MAKRVLKLPDGGTLDLPIPDGFGSPILATNAVNPLNWNRGWLFVGVVFGLAAAVSLWKAHKG
jgi:hypothetical protein